ncbi:MAG: hypothetical protein WD066_14955 [Planctomycetaceae bacterium]
MAAAAILTALLTIVIGADVAPAERSSALQEMRECTTAPETDARALSPVDVEIGDDALGWQLFTVSHDSGSKRHAVIVSPSGRRFDVPEIFGLPRPGGPNLREPSRPRMQVIDVPALQAQFLLIYRCPEASAPAALSSLLLKDGEIAGKAAIGVLHRFEWIPIPSGEFIVAQLFEDVDGDGRPELIENDVGKFGGTMTYHQFDGSRFRPRWRDEYIMAPPGGNAIIVKNSRIDLGADPMTVEK